MVEIFDKGVLLWHGKDAKTVGGLVKFLFVVVVEQKQWSDQTTIK
jgi:hypothetical protein